MEASRNQGRKKLIADLILIASIILLAAFLFLFFFLGAEGGSHVAVYVGNEEIGRYSLLIDAEYVLNGGTNVLVIEDGTARIERASCPDALCVHQGKISRVGERIVCLPNKLTVEVIGG